MTDDLGVLRERIRALLDRTEHGSELDPIEVEHTLTDGYARALALEAARDRTAGRIHALAGDDGHALELRELKAQVTSVDSELAELRSMLKVLAATL